MKKSKPFRLIGYVVFFLFITSCSKDFKESSVVKTSSGDQSQLGLSKANIILIVGDDVGREIPTYNGGQSYATPNLDFMAANGKQFPYFFSHPDGPPSRLALVTGKYNYRNWVKFGYLDPSSLTFANMLKNAGYATCYIGKWQLDGGDASIKSHGFNKYLAFMPYNPQDNNGHDQFYRRYKNPYLYENSHYLSKSKVKGRYSEDLFFDYASNFIDSNKNKPFFMMYANNLVMKPWSPSPDDPAFAAWDPAKDDATELEDSHEDTIYFPGMVAYMDKMIGQLINKVKAAGIAEKTLIIFISDNATYVTIRSYYKGKKIRGSKDSTTFNGINVPMLAYMPGTIAPGTTDTSLIDMTDFFPTFARIAGANISPYKPLDGTSFFDNLKGSPSSLSQRNTVYCYWPREYQQKVNLSYVFNYKYKLYDSLNGSRFYDIRADYYEKKPIPDNKLTSEQKKIKNQFTVLLRQGFK